MISPRVVLTFFLALFIFSCQKSASVEEESERSLHQHVSEWMVIAEQKVNVMIATSLDSAHFPRSYQDKKVRQSKASGWTSGFYPGILWRMYEFTGNDLYKSEAERFLRWLEPNKSLPDWNTHDLGFMMYPPFGKAFELTGDTTYQAILRETADSLANLYNPKVGTTLSWPWRDEWSHPTIIDNLLNLELLFWSSRNTGDSTHYHIAVDHLDTTLKYHLREDYSTYHLVNYDASTGEVISKETDQGASDESTWSRGQAWAVYGYTMGYRETGDSTYLDVATQLARYYLSQLPQDKIPYWDFSKTGQAEEPRDVSSIAIFLSAFVDLSRWSAAFSEDASLQLIKHLLTHLKTTYQAEEEVPFILDHSTGSKPHKSEVDIPIIYADYYLVEALLKLKTR